MVISSRKVIKMGVNAVVIVENSRNILFNKFISALKADMFGRFAWNSEDAWDEFKWEGKRYFSWDHPPKTFHLDLYNFDRDSDEPDADNRAQLTFLKVMYLIEELAGGPVFVGNDVGDFHTPAIAESVGESFFLPPKLDILLPNW